MCWRAVIDTTGPEKPWKQEIAPCKGGRRQQDISMSRKVSEVQKPEKVLKALGGAKKNILHE